MNRRKTKIKLNLDLDLDNAFSHLFRKEKL